MSDCPYAGRTWPSVRCKFEPRYDIGKADLSQFKSIARMTDGMLEHFRPKTYVHDVCVTCGKTVARKP